jgi:hypothetical protein
VGFNNNAVVERSATPEQSADLLADVGADIDRVQIGWVRLEPAPGVYNFATYDAIYAADLARGIRPLFNFAFAPAWASGGVCPDSVSSCHAPPNSDHYDDAARTAAAIAARYPQAAGIEIWNEPNTRYFWRPGPDPAAYTRLLAACHAAIKAVDPSMAVAGGSMASGMGGSPGKIPAGEFLASMYANGAAGSMDAISAHAYPDPTVASAVDWIDSLVAVRNAAEDAATPVWVTEVGMTTTGVGAVSEAAQATGLAALDGALRSVPAVRMVLFNTLVESPRGAANPETGFGVVATDLRKKPAYCALGASWGAPAACADATGG